jgi:hypothetical protein
LLCGFINLDLEPVDMLANSAANFFPEPGCNFLGYQRRFLGFERVYRGLDRAFDYGCNSQVKLFVDLVLDLVYHDGRQLDLVHSVTGLDDTAPDVLKLSLDHVFHLAFEVIDRIHDRPFKAVFARDPFQVVPGELLDYAVPQFNLDLAVPTDQRGQSLPVQLNLDSHVSSLSLEIIKKSNECIKQISDALDYVSPKNTDTFCCGSKSWQ